MPWRSNRDGSVRGALGNQRPYPRWMGSEPVRSAQICRRSSWLTAPARESAEHQVTVGLPVAAHAKMAPAELVLEAGVHSFRIVTSVRGIAGSRDTDSTMARRAVAIPSQFLLQLRSRTAHRTPEDCCRDDRNMAPTIAAVLPEISTAS